MTNDSLMAVKSIAECSKDARKYCRRSILQYFQPSLSDNRSWKPFLVFLRVAILHRFYCSLLLFIINQKYYTLNESWIKKSKIKLWRIIWINFVKGIWTTERINWIMVFIPPLPIWHEISCSVPPCLLWCRWYKIVTPWFVNLYGR